MLIFSLQCGDFQYHTCTMCALCMHSACNMCAPCMRSACTIYVPCIHHACTMHAPCMNHVCTMYEPCMHHVFTMYAPYICAMYAPCMFVTYTGWSNKKYTFFWDFRLKLNTKNEFWLFWWLCQLLYLASNPSITSKNVPMYLGFFWETQTHPPLVTISPPPPFW